MKGSGGTVPGAPSGIDLGIDGLDDPILIGQGGFGAVYRAVQPSLGRTVAVKILSAPGFDDRTRDRFTRECVAIGALSGHPHIVTVYDSGINAWGRPFIVMDHMTGGSIADRVASEGPLPWPDAIDAGVKITGAVATAHAASILHRDIKPQNVLISPFGEPKLGDFGISSIGGEQTNSGSVTASLEHAAPELLEGSAASVHSDVYALASTIFTMIAGHAPHERRPDEPIQSLITRILTAPVPDLRPRGVPGAVADVLERALDKDPARRPASANEFASALRSAQESQGVTPTEVVAMEGGAFELVDRFSPPRASTTAPTRHRARPEHVPPAPTPDAPPFWKRPVGVAAIAISVLVVAAVAFAVMLDGRDEPALQNAVAEAPESEEAAAPSTAPDRSEQDGDRGEKSNGPRNDGSRGSRDGGGGNSVPAVIPPPVPDTAGSSSAGSGTGTGSSSAGTEEGSSDSGGNGSQPGESKEQEPDKPPPPDVWLYHVWKGREHVATTNPAAYPSDYARHAEGLVYDYQARGTIPITTAEGTMYVFAEPFGDTEPDVNRTRLYKMTKGSEYFYTSSSQTKTNYYTRFDWSVQETGYIGQ